MGLIVWPLASEGADCRCMGAWSCILADPAPGTIFKRGTLRVLCCFFCFVGFGVRLCPVCQDLILDDCLFLLALQVVSVWTTGIRHGGVQSLWPLNVKTPVVLSTGVFEFGCGGTQPSQLAFPDRSISADCCQGCGRGFESLRHLQFSTIKSNT